MRRNRAAMGICKLAALFWALALPALGDELRIITSYQADVVDPMLEGFARCHPDIRIRVLNKNTHAAVDEVLAGNDRRFDLFWASAPEAFVVLDGAGRLADLGHGPYADFAWSAVGWTWRAGRDGPVPQDWNDLLDPDFAQGVAMSHPMRSGTMHSLLETILQDRGWQAGWAWILELAGQLNTISARSFGVLEGVESGDFAIGLTIDFLALTREGLVFRYGRPVILIPARIAALQGGTQPDAAREFMDFVLSPEGQRILLHPDIRRIPADPDIRAELSESLDPAIRAALNFSWSRYDPDLAARRYWQVKQLFEAFVARDLLLRRELWRRLRALDDAPREDRIRIRRLLTWMPLTEYQARSAPPDRQTLLEWSERSHAILRDAEALIRALEQP
ncbi:ABC transporter substrate-binding protein [Paracoccus pantotrophus]|uniref:ABC transporter substrate-binding protein n=1 Tax=Paracoccus pantotrophus TaxID=82367 RepID=UPI00215D8866|nr:substrate-binding domain-containing protein [Paracoccus pantotrophus]